MGHPARRWTAAVGLWLLLASGAATAATAPHIVRTDLEPLIQAAAPSKTQFAVEISYAISTAKEGAWSTAAGRATWHYAVRIPTASSLSFHVARGRLPASAVLTVTGISTRTSYGGKDLHHSVLWSRIQPGDTLELSLSVASGDKAGTQLEIDSFQAGYRALGPGAQDHPYYRKLQQRTAADVNSSCVQNYMCSVSAANTPAGQATVGIVIGNLYQCTGTLINDIPQDNTPYVLTARHCETGTPGGGDPSAASNVTVYWDAVTPCSTTTLGSLYDPSIQRQSGATTVVEQQDAWLIRLDESPVVTDAQFAGLDASGGTIQGGYTIHHALGYDKQYTTWYGAALAVQQSNVLGVSYVSNFWETVNATGNIGPGTSGSGLFNQNNALAGSASLGRAAASNSTGYEACPVGNPSAPDGSNGAADFTSLAAVWNSTADTTSNTSGTTLKSVLDPQNTGTLSVGSAPAANLYFTSDDYSLTVGQSISLTWNAAGAIGCTGTGGVTGDGWAGSHPASGTQSITESTPVGATFTLTCQLPGNRSITANQTVTWGAPQPNANMSGSGTVWINTPATLTWTSNVSPCSITGGSLSAANLASSGSLTTTQGTTGTVEYSLQCGTASTGQIFTSSTVVYVTPSLDFLTNSTDLQLGQPLHLGWITWAQTCVPSGGAPNDGWTNTAFGNPNDPNALTSSPHVTTLGTYTYTLTCSSGSISIQKSVTVTFENNPGYVTTSVTPTTVTFSDTPADTVTVTYMTNLEDCYFQTSPLTGGAISGGFDAANTWTWTPPAPGVYALSVLCNPYDTIVGQVTSTPVNVTVLPPAPAAASLSITPATVAAGQSFVVTWSSTDTMNCSGSGDSPPEYVWNPMFTNGQQTGISQTPGQYTLDMSCQSIVPGAASATAQATLTITATTSTGGGGTSSGGTGSSSGGTTNSSSGKSGGGGLLSITELLVLAAGLGMSRRPRIHRKNP